MGGPDQPASTSSDHTPRGSRRVPFTIAAAFIAPAVVAAIAAAWYFRDNPAARAEHLLEEAYAAYGAGRDEAAETAATAALEANPQLAEAARLAAELNHYRLHRLTRAERLYRTALEVNLDDPVANEGLAKLLALCGRRSEAIPHVLRLVRADRAGDLLVLLARETGAINDRAALDSARRAASDDPLPLIGLANLAALDEQPAEAIDLLREALHREPDHPAAHVALGEQLLAASRFDDLIAWQEQLPAAADDFASTWFVRGRLAEHGGDAAGAVRCYWESVRRAPESKRANFNLARLLGETGGATHAEPFAAHVRAIIELETAQDRVLFTGDQDDPREWLNLIARYEAAGRVWEAFGWCRLIAPSDPRHEIRSHLDDLHRRVQDLPLRLTADAANPALSVDLSAHPLPRFGSAAGGPVASSHASAANLSFRDDAQAAGLRFRYFNGTEGTPTRRMYEFTGGGAGVLDFDLDGFPDALFTQGRPWPPGTASSEYRDTLFRNLRGGGFEDVTHNAGLREDGFGQGIAIGDFDSDGFPDVYVANIGPNRLWRNNGDGTFTDVTIAAGVAGDEWTTSCVLADLNADGWPDLYAANYVTAPDVFDRVCRNSDGSPRMCLPFEFDGQRDRLYLNGGNGTFRDATPDALSTAPDGKGLGVAVWDAHGSGRLSLFVANDTTPSFFFVNEANGDSRFQLQERGIEVGLALNGDGKATGAMGVALGDVDEDGRLDVHVTNFLAEPNSLFLSVGGGLFADRTRAMGLHAPSLDVLGFGTQFLDADLDGRLELFVANGHVDDLRTHGKPWHMRPQLFRREGTQLVEVAANELGPYFEREWLGRPVARLDWNRDGREDLIVGHLDMESALLTNTTPDTGRFLALKLVATQSSRDAIGTTVRVRSGDRTLLRQLTAGDGYQASNERQLVFGLDEARQADELTIHWPSGLVQSFPNVAGSQHICVVEGRTLLPLPAADSSP